MSIPSNWPIKNPIFFEYNYHDMETDFDVYKLNASKLSEDECHLFFPVEENKELLIATTLEYMTFHPENKKMNDKFNIQAIKCGNLELFWCKFPKEFKDVCERAASIYGMTMKTMNRCLVYKGVNNNGTVVEFPNKENIISFEGERSEAPEMISKLCDCIVMVGNLTEKLGVD